MLKTNAEKRPSCQQLIQSKLFQTYCEKLISLDSVDATFNATLGTSSPGRDELALKTSNLLKTIYVPSNLDSLTTYLPRKNY